VEALAADEDAGVVRIFCANWLRTLLLEYARTHGRPEALVARAEELLLQPGDSAAHDDHFHVRVACTPEERIGGCRDGSPLPWWLERNWLKTVSAPTDDDALLALLADPVPPEATPPTPARRARTGHASARVAVPRLRELRTPPTFRGRGPTRDELDEPVDARAPLAGEVLAPTAPVLSRAP
jgi:hypothetical protein